MKSVSLDKIGHEKYITLTSLKSGDYISLGEDKYKLLTGVNLSLESIKARLLSTNAVCTLPLCAISEASIIREHQLPLPY